MGLRSSGEPDRTPRRARKKQRRKRGQRRRSDPGGQRGDGRMTEAWDSYDDVDSDKDPFGFDLLPGGSDLFVSFLLHGPGAVDCADWFKNLSRDMTSERTRVGRREGGVTKGPPRIFYLSSASNDYVAI